MVLEVALGFNDFNVHDLLNIFHSNVTILNCHHVCVFTLTALNRPWLYLHNCSRADVGSFELTPLPPPPPSPFSGQAVCENRYELSHFRQFFMPCSRVGKDRGKGRNMLYLDVYSLSRMLKNTGHSRLPSPDKLYQTHVVLVAHHINFFYTIPRYRRRQGKLHAHVAKGCKAAGQSE